MRGEGRGRGEGGGGYSKIGQHTTGPGQSFLISNRKYRLDKSSSKTQSSQVREGQISSMRSQAPP